MKPITPEEASAVGVFTPTWLYDSSQAALIITLDQKLYIAVTQKAENPADDSLDARCGRSLLKEITVLHQRFCKDYGQCEVRIVLLRYDGEAA
jgi:hypothetical protein